MKSKTISNFVKYFAGDIFVKGFLFISLPLLSRVMGPSDYGKLSLINSAIMILYVFISLNLQNAVINSFMRNDVDFPRYLGSVLIGLLPFQIIFLVLCPVYAGYLAPILGISSDDVYWVVFICTMLSYIYIYTSYLQGAMLGAEFVKVNTISKIAEIIIIFFIAYSLAENKYLSKAYAQSIVSLILIIYVAKRLSRIAILKFDFKYFKAALLFSIPLIPHVLSNSLLSQADRIIIKNLSGEYEAGIYSFAYNLGMCIIVVIMAWNSSWQPKLYSLINERNDISIKKVVNSSSIIVAFTSVAAMLFSKELVYNLAGNEYRVGYEVVPVVIIGNALIHVYLSYVNFTFFNKKTFVVSLGTMAALVINIYLNFKLIPILGINGAAWATVFSYFSLSLFQYFISKYILKINPLSLMLLMSYTAFLLIGYSITQLINTYDEVISILIKIIIICGMVIFVAKNKIYNDLKV